MVSQVSYLLFVVATWILSVCRGASFNLHVDMALREVSKKLQELAIKELNEDPKRIRSDIDYIKNWLSQQKYITSRTDDQMILSFLRGCKFSLERTKEKIDMYHTIRTITPEFYENRDPLLPELQEILSLGCMLPLPVLPGPAGPRVCYVRNAIHDPSKISQVNIMKVGLMIQDILLLEDDNYAIAGIQVVVDATSLTMSHVLSVTPSLLKKTMVCFQQGYPTRIKGLHITKAPAVFEALNNIIKPIFPEKVKKRMILHSNDKIDKLFKIVPKSIFPIEFGGESGTLEELVKYWKDKVESYRDWFLEDAKYKTDEKKRPGKQKTVDSIFGIEGSFRQLAVD